LVHTRRTKIVATRYVSQLQNIPKCICGSGGPYRAPPDPIAGFKEATWWKKGEGMLETGGGGGGRWIDFAPPFAKIPVGTQYYHEHIDS